jgi:hypothetical protein
MAKLFATSFERYNGGVRIKRLHGSSTVTRFYVGEKGSNPSTWEIIEAYGPTPGDRKTYALNKYIEKMSKFAAAEKTFHPLADDSNLNLAS